jgi:hypothetical protein
MAAAPNRLDNRPYVGAGTGKQPLLIGIKRYAGQRRDTLPTPKKSRPKISAPRATLSGETPLDAGAAEGRNDHQRNS